MTTQLAYNDHVQLTLSDGKTLVLTTEGWGFDGLDIPRSKPVSETTGRSKRRSSISTEVHDYTFPFSIRQIDNQTDNLIDEIGNTIAWERGIGGTASGSHKDSGKILIMSITLNAPDGVCMMTIAAEGQEAWVEGTY